MAKRRVGGFLERDPAVAVGVGLLEHPAVKATHPAHAMQPEHARPGRAGRRGIRDGLAVAHHDHALAADLTRDGLKAAAPDAATAALLADAVCSSAALTARVNLGGLQNKTAAPAMLSEADSLTREARAYALRATAFVGNAGG